MNSSRFLPSLFMLAILAGGTAQAEITRSCSASVDVFVIDKKPNAMMVLANIEGRGSCKNKLHSSDCRRRARAEVDRCRNDMWAGRHSNAIPPSCNNLVEGSSRSGAKLQYDGIYLIAEPQRLTARGAAAVCCHLRPKADQLIVSFEGRISGDEQCAAHKIGPDKYQEEYGFTNKYEMNCKKWREQGICG